MGKVLPLFFRVCRFAGEIEPGLPDALTDSRERYRVVQVIRQLLAGRKVCSI